MIQRLQDISLKWNKPPPSPLTLKTQKKCNLTLKWAHLPLFRTLIISPHESLMLNIGPVSKRQMDRHKFFSSPWFFFWWLLVQTQTDGQKATPKSPPCLSTGGLKNLTCWNKLFPASDCPKILEPHLNLSTSTHLVLSIGELRWHRSHATCCIYPLACWSLLVTWRYDNLLPLDGTWS